MREGEEQRSFRFPGLQAFFCGSFRAFLGCLSLLYVFRCRGKCCDLWNRYKAGNNVPNHRVTDVDLIIMINESFEYVQLCHRVDKFL